MKKLYVIGIGCRPLDRTAREIVLSSKRIYASRRLSEVFSGHAEFEEVRQRVVVSNAVDETISSIRKEMEGQGGESVTIALLASGDPLFHGIGRRALEEFGREVVEIIPEVSSVQLAFSRIKEPWDDSLLLSLHGGPHASRGGAPPFEKGDLPLLLRSHRKIAVLTDRVNTPAAIALDLLGPDTAPFREEIRMYVCERLGHPDGRITEATPQEIAEGSFSEPNVVIIMRKGELREGSGRGTNRVSFGLREDDIIHERGLITKDEVRAVTLHKLRLPESGVLWDIGAGSGSLSLEAARLCPGLKVFAIEREGLQRENIRRNIIGLGATNVTVIPGEAPEALKSLPEPHRVFIGGSGGRLRGIIEHVASLATGCLVLNAATFETLREGASVLEEKGFTVEVTQVSVSRMKPLGEGHCLAALNPVFIIQGLRGER